MNRLGGPDPEFESTCNGWHWPTPELSDTTSLLVSWVGVVRDSFTVLHTSDTCLQNSRETFRGGRFKLSVLHSSYMSYFATVLRSNILDIWIQKSQPLEKVPIYFLIFHTGLCVFETINLMQCFCKTLPRTLSNKLLNIHYKRTLSQKLLLEGNARKKWFLPQRVLLCFLITRAWCTFQVHFYAFLPGSSESF